MGDFTGIFSGKNELAKFMTIGGLLCIIFSFYYPLEKSKEYSIRKIELEYQIDLYCLQSKDLKQTYDATGMMLDDIQTELVQKRITDLRKKEIKNIVKTLKEKIRKEKFNHDSKKLEITKLKDQLSVSKNYQDSYDNYFLWSIIIGILLALIGFISWIVSGVTEHRAKRNTDSFSG